MKIYNDNEKLFPKVAKTVTLHREHLEIFKMVNKRIKLLALRLQIPDRKEFMVNSLNNNEVSSIEKKNQIQNYILFIQEQKELLNEIKPEFEKIWLQYNKRPMLDENLEKYDKLYEYYDALIQEAENYLSSISQP